MFLRKGLFIFCFFLIPTAYSEVQDTERTGSSFKKPLVLQWEVSHARNTDQISLIFRQDTVELVTNTSSYQKGKAVRLGRFKSSMDPKLEEWKGQIELFYEQLRKTVPMSTLIKDPRVQPKVTPHAPVLRIGEEEIQGEHPYFKPLARIIYQVWERDWICVECAIYMKKKKSITRTVRVLKPALKGKTAGKKKNQSKAKEQWKVTKQKFAKRLLNCIPKGKQRTECVDPQFGIFEI